MGQQLFMFISNQCDSFADTYSPGIQSTGMHILMAMATVMLVWFGVQEALASAQGGPGFNMAKFMNFFLLITFAYCFTSFYNGSIPGLGFSLKSFIVQGTSSLADTIGNDSNHEMLQTVEKALQPAGSGGVSLNLFTGAYAAIAYIGAQVDLMLLDAVCAVILAYGAVAGTIIGMVGPIFIPFLVFEKTEFLFWGWLKAFLSFEFFKVVAAATMSLLGHLLMSQVMVVTSALTSPGAAIAALPVLTILTVISIYIVLKIPAITVSIFSGSAGGHDAGVGIVASMITKAALA